MTKPSKTHCKQWNVIKTNLSVNYVNCIVISVLSQSSYDGQANLGLCSIWKPCCRLWHALVICFYMYVPNFEEVRDNIFLQMWYIKNCLTFEFDILYTVSWPYVEVLISFWVGCVKYCHSNTPFCEKWM